VDGATVNRVILNAIFPGEPVAWERVMFRGPYMIKPKKTRQAQAKLRRQLRMITGSKLRPNERARFGVQLVFRTTSSRKDGDNCEKLVLDAFLKKVWYDDSQIDECSWRMQRVIGGEVSTHLIVYVIE
jgi:Holliday junction resolvase RusA-like endonuclease